MVKYGLSSLTIKIIEVLNNMSKEELIKSYHKTPINLLAYGIISEEWFEFNISQYTIKAYKKEKYNFDIDYIITVRDNINKKYNKELKVYLCENILTYKNKSIEIFFDKYKKYKLNEFIKEADIKADEILNNIYRYREENNSD